MELEQVSHYLIRERLGEGGMGVVYKAEDTKLKRTVALKFIAPNRFEDSETKARFINEAQSAASLNHPHINTIYEIDEAEGQTFIAMEYVEGKSLKAKLKEKPLELKAALDIAVQVAEGLEEAHDKGIVHRDIKSSNIMLDTRGRAKIMDFGLAKSSGSTRLTGTAVILGTVSYMSPEQAIGENVTHQTDIWSFGIMLYEMLTGQLPFKGDQDQLVLYSILNEDPYPVTGLRSGIPLELEMIINKCLEKDPAARYQSASEVIVDLKRLTRDMTSGRLYSIQGQRKKSIPAKKKMRLWTIPAVSLVLLALALGIPGIRSRIMQLFNPIPDYQVLAVLPFSVSEEGSELQDICNSLAVTLTNQLGLYESFQDSLLVIPSNDVIKRKIDSAAEARKQVGANLVITGHCLLLQDTVKLQLNLSRTDPLRQITSDELVYSREHAQALLAGNGVVLKVLEMLAFEVRPEISSVFATGGSDNPDALIFYAEGLEEMYGESSAGYIDRAIEKFKKAQEKDPEFVSSYAELSLAYWEKWLVTKDSLWIDIARSECEKALTLEANLASVYTALGLIASGSSEYDKAEENFLKALQQDPAYRKAHIELGNMYQKQEKWEQAELQFKEVIRLRPDYRYNYRYLGLLYFYTARYKEAEEIFQGMVDNMPQSHLGSLFMGLVYQRTGRPEQAIASYKKSLTISPSYGAYSNLGYLYFFYKKDYTRARQNFEEANILEPNNLTVQGNLADAYRYSGDSKNAAVAYKRAIQLAEKVLEVNPADARTRAKAARYYALQGDKSNALRHINIALKHGSENVEVLVICVKVFELIGQRDRAFESLEDMVSLGGDLGGIRVNPDLEEFTQDPRFKAFIDK